MHLLSPIVEAVDGLIEANRYSRLFALSDRELETRGLTRAALKDQYFAEIDRVAEARARGRGRLQKRGGFAHSG